MTLLRVPDGVAQCFRHEGPPRQWWCEHPDGSWSWCNTDGHRAIPWRHHGGAPVTAASLLQHGWVAVPNSEWHDAMMTLQGRGSGVTTDTPPIAGQSENEEFARCEHCGQQAKRHYVNSHGGYCLVCYTDGAPVQKLKQFDEMLTALKNCLSWHHGDKWRNSEHAEERAAWENHKLSIESVIHKAEGAK
jgi:hypothetical protein